jgi:hypothetical protein
MWTNVLQLALLPCQREGLTTVHVINDLPSDETDHCQAVPTQMLLTPREEFWKLYCTPDIEVIKQCLYSLIQTDHQSFLIYWKYNKKITFQEDVTCIVLWDKSEQQNHKNLSLKFWYRTSTDVIYIYIADFTELLHKLIPMKQYSLLYWSEYFSSWQMCLWP